MIIASSVSAAIALLTLMALMLMASGLFLALRKKTKGFYHGSHTHDTLLLPLYSSFTPGASEDVKDYGDIPTYAVTASATPETVVLQNYDQNRTADEKFYTSSNVAYGISRQAYNAVYYAHEKTRQAESQLAHNDEDDFGYVDVRK